MRLDALSSPSVYQECGTKPTCRVVEGQGGDGVPQGFAKVRVQGEGAENWAEFINAAGFLRRSVRCRNKTTYFIRWHKERCYFSLSLDGLLSDLVI